MVNQNKIFSFELKRQAKNVFPKDVERTVDYTTPGEVFDQELMKTPFMGRLFTIDTVYERQNFFKVVVQVIIIDQCN